MHPSRNLALPGLLLALLCFGSTARAQAPVAQNLDVFFGEPKLLPLARPIDSFSVTPDSIVRVDKVDGSPNQLMLTGVGGGNAVLTLKSDNQSFVYDIAVSPAPERVYINLNESKRLSFPNPIDDTRISNAGIVRVVQPDSSDNVLLVEANQEGKTTLTVYSKGQIYRYFISTFDNRGADILEIQNAFSAKGYRNLKIEFDKDEAIISGTVPTQEELDDAVKIVKQYTDYVVIKAQLGEGGEGADYTEEELIIINNIQRIANVKGLTIRVKFPPPTTVTTSDYIKSTGDYISPQITTTPQGGTIRGAGFEQPADPNSQSGNPTGTLEPKPQQNTTETVDTTRRTTIPEKIFLYGDLQDDLEEAKVIRVARTFCPFVVSFLTVRDPIQLRTQIRFLQVNDSKDRDTGFAWTSSGVGSEPTISLGFGGNAFTFGSYAPSSAGSILNFLSSGITGSISAEATLHLYETLGYTKLLREAEVLMTNGQPGWYSEGEVQSYVSSSITTTSSPPVTTLTASSVFLGVNLDIAPLNLAAAGGTEPTGQKIFGIPGSIGANSSTGYTLEQNTEPTADKVTKLNEKIQDASTGTAPVIDNTVKYVDENGLIGLDVSTQLTLPNGPINSTANRVFFGSDNQYITLPDFFVRTTRTRANVRDGQSLAIDGLIDHQVIRNITQIPFLSSIPIFGKLFTNTVDSASHEEVVVLITPHIVRMRDPDSSRYPKPKFSDLQDLARADGEVPIIKPVRYAPPTAETAPGDSKDGKDSKDAPLSEPGVTITTDAPLQPRATGGMQTLAPADNSPATPPPDTAPPPAGPTQRIAAPPPPPPLPPPSTLP